MNDHSSKTDEPILEVIACSVEDAIDAEVAGADRLEVIRDLESGGYTPSLDLVREIRDTVGLPLRVMLREEACYGLTEVITVEKLCCVANELNGMKLDGVVLGFLRSRDVDVELTQKILGCAPDLKATFHHAFEDAKDKTAAIRAIKRIPQIDKILSHGGYGSPAVRVENLREYARLAGPEIQILAGGRVDLEMIRELRMSTPIREFHVGSAARKNGQVSLGRVRELSEVVRSLYV
jgi:copper homeostasis protein